MSTDSIMELIFLPVAVYNITITIYNHLPSIWMKVRLLEPFSSLSHVSSPLYEVKMSQIHRLRGLLVVTFIDSNPCKHEWHGFVDRIEKTVDAEWVYPHEWEVAHREVAYRGSEAPDVMERQTGKLTSPAQCSRDSTEDTEIYRDVFMQLSGRAWKWHLLTITQFTYFIYK